ncbi:MAG: PKD domain-containing protein [Anaerolineales bacterium]|nr:PKD domain-containing protein [Anaerolineales bacterium]
MVTLEPGQTQVVSVTFDTNTSQGLGENQGFVVMDGAVFDAHMPVWARVTPATQISDVLIIDNDASDLDPSFGDYLYIYTSTLTALGKTYSIANPADYFGLDQTIPRPAVLSGFGAILWYTGDNYVPVAGLTTQDQYSLLDYLNNGGIVIAMGQDLAGTLDAAPGTDFNWLYNWGLGARWLQDSISNGNAPTGFATSAPSMPPFFRNIIVSLLQLYVDEVAPELADRAVARGGVAVLNYGGPFNLGTGTAALVHRDQPVLESPVPPFWGRAFYASFGLEGMDLGPNEVLTPTLPTTPVELLGHVLTWAESEVGMASISNTTPATTTAITLFTAHYTSTAPTGYPAEVVNPIAWRWDFGDGSAYVASVTQEAGHTYVCSENNVYTVRVQVTDGMGNNAIGSLEVDVSDSCFQEPETVQNFFLPWITK